MLSYVPTSVKPEAAAARTGGTRELGLESPVRPLRPTARGDVRVASLFASVASGPPLPAQAATPGLSLDLGAQYANDRGVPLRCAAA